MTPALVVVAGLLGGLPAQSLRGSRAEARAFAWAPPVGAYELHVTSAPSFGPGMMPGMGPMVPPQKLLLLDTRTGDVWGCAWETGQEEVVRQKLPSAPNGE